MPGIEQQVDALARQQLALLALALDRVLAAAEARGGQAPAEILLERVHVREVLAELRGGSVHVRLEDGHGGEYTIAVRGDEGQRILRTSALRTVATLNVALHVLGLVLAALVLRPGTPAAPLAARASYLAARPLGWTLGWLVWIACAAALAAFMVLLARAWPSAWTRAGAGLTLVAAAIDVACDIAYVSVLPARAATDLAAFVSFEHRLGAGQLDRGQRPLFRRGAHLHSRPAARRRCSLAALGVLTFVGGMALAAAGVTGDPRHVLVGHRGHDPGLHGLDARGVVAPAVSAVAVLGGYGTFGARVSRELARRGHRVTVAGRDLARAAALAASLGDGHRAAEVNATDVDSCRRALQGAAVVAVCAGPFSALGAAPRARGAAREDPLRRHRG